jgi:hypothetical protein
MTPKQVPDARVVDDTMAEAHERAERIEQSAGQEAAPSDTEPLAPNVGDLGTAPCADVDHAVSLPIHRSRSEPSSSDASLSTQGAIRIRRSSLRLIYSQIR